MLQEDNYQKEDSFSRQNYNEQYKHKDKEILNLWIEKYNKGKQINEDEETLKPWNDADNREYFDSKNSRPEDSMRAKSIAKEQPGFGIFT